MICGPEWKVCTPEWLVCTSKWKVCTPEWLVCISDVLDPVATAPGSDTNDLVALTDNPSARQSLLRREHLRHIRIGRLSTSAEFVRTPRVLDRPSLFVRKPGAT